MEADLLPFDDYQEEVQDRQGHHLRKTVHKHRFDDGIDIDLETNEDYDPLALQSYLSENIPKAAAHRRESARKIYDAQHKRVPVEATYTLPAPDVIAEAQEQTREERAAYIRNQH